MIRIPTFITLLLVVIVPSDAEDTVDGKPPLRWWRGNIHTHSLWSDGDDFPEMISDWYRTNGYHFLAISDHNVLSQGQRWMSRREIEERGGQEVLSKYVRRFSSAWVEERPVAGADGECEIRLKPFNEYRSLLEERGKFLLMPGEEISDQVGGRPVHMNVTNVEQVIAPLGGGTVSEVMEANFRAVEEQSRELGREMIVHLNHPNFGYAVTAEELARVVSERFFEVYNGHTDVNNLGDADHPGTDRIWDYANTVRLSRLGAKPLMAVATDDSHDYHGGRNSPGRGWIMVQARFLTPESLIRAMKAGHFYASSGVTLKSIDFHTNTNRFTLRIASEPGVNYETRFVGSRKSDFVAPADIAESRDSPTLQSWQPAKAGVLLHKQAGEVASYQLTGDEMYLRAVVLSDKLHPNPSYANQKQMAWTQPVGWSPVGESRRPPL